MKNTAYEEYRANPTAVLERVERGARRERAEAMDDFVLAPLMRRLRRLMPKPVQLLQTRSA